jgi:hypothetical protein
MVEMSHLEAIGEAAARLKQARLDCESANRALLGAKDKPARMAAERMRCTAYDRLRAMEHNFIAVARGVSETK